MGPAHRAAESGHVYPVLNRANAAEHAFVYTSGPGMVDLNSLIDPLSGWELLTSTEINDAGQITGRGLIGGESHAFLLTPVPEPSSLALAALVAGAVAIRRKRILYFQKQF